MARGWESKSVESQVEDARNREPRGERRDPAKIEAEQKRSSLALSRRRIERELAVTSSQVHRAALERALEHLDRELERLATISAD